MERHQKRARREYDIISKTIELLSQRGFLDVRMSDIASKTGYSMGSIYSHFESKEDLLVACAHTLSIEYKKLLQLIMNQSIPAIEKIITMAQCNWHISMQHTDLIEIDSLSLMPSVWRRATPNRANALNESNKVLAGMFLTIALEAIKSSLIGYKHLKTAEIEQLGHYFTHGMWGLCVGLASTSQSGYANSLCPENSTESYTHFTTNYINFLKGYGWQEVDPVAIFEARKANAMACIAQTSWFSGHKVSQLDD